MMSDEPYRKISVNPDSGCLGAEVEGVDGSRPMNSETLGELLRALVEHLVIFLRDQTLSIEQLESFSAGFGSLFQVPFVKPLDDHPNVIAVLKEADERAHPVARRHPESDETALYVNPVYTTRFEGMSESESAPLLDFLYKHCTRAEFTCRFRWRPGSLAVWDNRCTQHLAINDYDGRRRLMYRTTTLGEVPMGARREDIAIGAP